MLLFLPLALAPPAPPHPALDDLNAEPRRHGTTSLCIVWDGAPLVGFRRGGTRRGA